MSDDFDALIRGPEQPEPPRQVEPVRPRREPNRVLPWVVVGLIAVVLVGGGAAFAFLGPWGSDDAGPTPPPASAPSEEPSEEPAPDPSPEPVPGAAPLPEECRDLFSEPYYAELAATGATLSEQDTGPGTQIFDPDVPEVLESTIADAPHIECRWGFEDNFSVGILTVVAQVGSEESMLVTDALESAGFRGVPELGSIRYIKETPGNESFGPSGYSVFVRDGLLIVTRWLDWPAVGYTADIVNTVLPPLE